MENNGLVKRVLPLAILLVLVSCSGVKTVGYSHKILLKEGCEMKFSALCNSDEERFIVVQLSSENLVFAPSPKLKIMIFGGKTLELQGEALSSRPNDSAVLIGNFIVPISSTKSVAQFKIDKSQIEALKGGIQKVRLSTVPFVHRKTFNRDKLGKRLYDMLVAASSDF